MEKRFVLVPALAFAALMAGCVHERHYSSRPPVVRPPVARPAPAPLVVSAPATVVPVESYVVEPVAVHSTTYVVPPPAPRDPHRRPRPVSADKHHSGKHHSDKHHADKKPKASPKPAAVKPAAPKPAAKPAAPKPAATPAKIQHPPAKYHHAAPSKNKTGAPSKSAAKKR